MAGGPIFPSSAVPVTADRVFSNVHVGAGTTGVKRTEGLGWQANVGADATWELQFTLPPSIPTGTLKLVGKALANATSGAAKLNAKWAKVADVEDPSSATLNAEGTTTLTWAAGDNDDFKPFGVTLDAVSVGAGDENKVVVVALVGETTGWTLAQTLTLAHLRLIWE